MEKRARGFALALIVIAAAAAGAQTGAKAAKPLGTVTVSYDVQRIGGIASNQLAVWIEDAAGAYVKTLFATDFMARRKGFERKTQVCPEWVKASGIAAMSAAQIDALSGATQKAGRISLVWDCTDAAGKPLPAGTYAYKVEGNLRWEKRVLWTGKIEVGSKAVTSAAIASFLPDESSKEAGVLVTEVAAAFSPAAR